MDKIVETEKEKILIRNNIWDFSSLALVVFFPIAFLYFRNLTLVNPKEVLVTFLIFFSGGFFILLISRLFTERISKVAFLLNVCMLAIMLFGPIETRLVRYLPFVFYWHLVYIFITLIVLLGLFVFMKLDDQTTGKINQVIAAIFGFLIFINFSMAVPNLIKEVRKSKISNTPVLVEESKTASSENVYVLIFDEYSGLDALQRYTGYDNSSFYEQLVRLGFNVSPHSRNYTTNTNIEITNVLNLSMALNNQNYSISARNELLKEPALFSLFKQHDYFVNVIDDQTMIPVDAKGIDRLYVGQSSLAKAETFQLVMLKHSVFYPFFTAKEGERAQEIKALFEEIVNSSTLQDQKLLTVGYFMFPHLPWVVDENGNQISSTERDNWKNPNAYLGQLKYVSSRIIEVVEGIIQKDPDAIIVLLSDHAYRLPAHLERLYGQKVEDGALEYDFQRNILNAVYFKGQKLDIEGLSGVNTLIKVINTQFSTEIPFVEPGN